MIAFDFVSTAPYLGPLFEHCRQQMIVITCCLLHVIRHRQGVQYLKTKEKEKRKSRRLYILTTAPFQREKPVSPWSRGNVDSIFIRSVFLSQTLFVCLNKDKYQVQYCHGCGIGLYFSQYMQTPTACLVFSFVFFLLYLQADCQLLLQAKV